MPYIDIDTDTHTVWAIDTPMAWSPMSKIPWLTSTPQVWSLLFSLETCEKRITATLWATFLQDTHGHTRKPPGSPCNYTSEGPLQSHNDTRHRRRHGQQDEFWVAHWLTCCCWALLHVATGRYLTHHALTDSQKQLACAKTETLSTSQNSFKRTVLVIVSISTPSEIFVICHCGSSVRMQPDRLWLCQNCVNVSDTLFSKTTDALNGN